MPVIDSVDYVNKKVYLSVDTVGVSLDTLDVYREVRSLRVTTEEHRKYDFFMVAGGNIQKQVGVFTQPYVQILFGWEIIPYDQAQTLTLVRDTFSDDGRAGAQCFNTSGFSSVVNIVESIDKVEVREVQGSVAASQIAEAVWSMDVDTVDVDGKTGANIKKIQNILTLIYSQLK